MRQRRAVYILLRMRYGRLHDEPEVFGTFEEVEQAFADYTGHSWDEVELLSEEAGGDLDQLLGGPYAGTRVLSVDIPSDMTLRDAA